MLKAAHSLKCASSQSKVALTEIQKGGPYAPPANRGKETGQALLPWAPKSLQMVTAAMKLKDACSLEEQL